MQQIPYTQRKILPAQLRGVLLSTTAISNMLKTIAGFAAAIGLQ
jgi:hypothetical protein